jgi:hypothetical protein
MIAIPFSLKLNSGSTPEAFEAVYIIPDWDEEAEKYDDINFTKRKISNAIWQVWDIRLGYLPVAKQDYLLQFKVQEAPQFVYLSTTWNVIVDEVTVRANGSNIRLINNTKEP